MKTFSILMLLLLFTSCKEIEDANPLSALTEGDQANLTDTSSQYIELVNNYRISIGLKSLILDQDLSAIALTHSSNMAKGVTPFGHTGFSARCDQARTAMGSGNLCGEIVASGQDDAKAVFNSWMGSSGHRAKIEESRYTHTGFGFAKSSSGNIYWTQVFLEVD